MRIIKMSLFKPSGKWYAGGDVKIPDDLNLYDDDCYERLCRLQRLVGGCHGLTMVVSYDGPDSFFFDHLFNIKEKTI